jgi:capsular polysaccharide export protein
MIHRRVGVLSRGMLRIPHLGALMGAEIVPVGGLRISRTCDAVAGWGLRPTSASARRFATLHGLPYLAVEDGFLRSVELGSVAPPLSLVVDDTGVYYDASKPSRLEHLISQALTSAQLVRADSLAALWRAGRVSKYNAARDVDPGWLPESFVLVVDQTRGDASIAGGRADASAFARMLQAALDENPGTPVLLKLHPDVVAGKGVGHFDPASLPRDARLRLLRDNVHLASLLANATTVYTVTSQAGFEALVWGCRLRCFGMPFYAGWSLGEDDQHAPTRRGSATLGQLVHAALIDYPRYIDPGCGESCEVEHVLEHLALQRHMRNRFPPVLDAVSLSPRKRFLARSFLRGSRVRSRGRPSTLTADQTAVLWGGAPAPEGAGHVIRLEDGFLRSVGLGAELVRPLSWVADGSGIYFDATRPSDLETLLQEGSFDVPLLARAARLRERIVAAGLGKYNLGGRVWQRPTGSAPVVLVVGQVESDAAVRLGAPGVRSNAALIAAVRAERPDAWLLYRPHPDVVAGLRLQGDGEQEAAALADEIVADCALPELLDAVCEVHVISSLAGFEALLRGRPVVCHGVPFYAGWGLTDDRQPAPRRTRRLRLDELVAAALIVYPSYVDRRGRHFCSAENALDELLEWRRCTAGRRPMWRRLMSVLLRLRAR